MQGREVQGGASHLSVDQSSNSKPPAAYPPSHVPAPPQGTYGMVYRAIDRANGRMVALKRVILHNEKADGFPLTSLREIRMLKKISHPNCVRMLVGRPPLVIGCLAMADVSQVVAATGHPCMPCKSTCSSGAPCLP
jgi:hypothetical protein